MPRQATIRKVADYFGVSVDDLLDDGIKKDTAVSGDVLSPLEAELMQYVRELSDEQKRFLLAQMQTLKNQESSSADAP